MYIQCIYFKHQERCRGDEKEVFQPKVKRYYNLFSLIKVLYLKTKQQSFFNVYQREKRSMRSKDQLKGQVVVLHPSLSHLLWRGN